MELLALDHFLERINADFKPAEAQIIRQAISLAQVTSENRATPIGISCLAQGIAIAEILHHLHLDSATLAAAILFNSVQYADLSIDDVAEHLGSTVAKLIHGTEQMIGISELYHSISGKKQYLHNIDNIRKMILAMVDDIRVVLIKLAEQLSILRHASILSEAAKQQIAAETMAIYAPLTHRLGIAQIKWELEDLAFCYLEPEKYREIAQALEQHFPERDQYIKEVIASISDVLTHAGVKDFQVTGRAKHVYSIYRKMNRKKVGLEGIFDVSAIRIFVPTVTDCYTALSHVHEHWPYIKEEFDDYIASPKSNNYSSIHTAVVGPKNRIVEIQIRTYEMHQHAELGIAAHWVYKEGKSQAPNYEAKIAWLRQVMDWQQEVTKSEDTLAAVRQMFNDRIYVFTPQGDIFELPQEATPLDFAYYLHSDLGHRCCGAKVNGSIVPLTHKLVTGERIEILTSKDGAPSRDWLIPNLGYLHTSRARSKVLHWFKKQSQERHIELGRELIAKEMQRLNLKKIDFDAAALKLNLKSGNELLAAVGNGDIKFSSILNALAIELELKSQEVSVPIVQSKEFKTQPRTSDINIYGLGNLLMHLANCCKPIPGEAVIGYITQGQGIAVHRADCCNALGAKKTRPERFIDVSWGSKTERRYPVNIAINAFDRPNLVRDVTEVLADENIPVMGLELNLDKKESLAKIRMTIETTGIKPLSRILAKIGSLPNIIEARRSS